MFFVVIFQVVSLLTHCSHLIIIFLFLFSVISWSTTVFLQLHHSAWVWNCCFAHWSIHAIETTSCANMLVYDILIETQMTWTHCLAVWILSSLSIYHMTLGCIVSKICLNWLSTLTFEIMEIFPYIFYRGFIHTHSLLQNMESSWNNIKLTHNFFKSLSKLFSTSTNSITIVGRSNITIMIKISSSSCSCTCLWFIWRSLSLWSSSKSRACSWSFWRWSPIYWWHTTSFVIIISSFGSKIFNELLFIFIKVTFPNHNYWVTTTSCEIITAWWKSSRCWRALMSIQGI